MDCRPTATMTSIKVEKSSPAFVQRSRLLTYREAIRNFHDLTRSCRSPRGKIKVLQNTSGGGLTMTSSSKRLFQSLSVRKPVIQLLVTSVQGHLNAYSDGGLLLATFAASLVLKSMDFNQSPKILAEIFETFLTFCVEHLHSSDCTFKYKAMMSDINFMKSFVKSVIGTKSLCEWNEVKLDFISKLILETFLLSVCSESQSLQTSDTVYIATALGLDALESRLTSGLLLPAPELSKFKIQDLKTKFTLHNKNKCIKVALVAVSASGDLDELTTVNYEVRQGVDIDSVILEGLSGFCESLVKSGVGLVLCQKVVHPQLKLGLRKSGVIVVDRIGLQPVKYIVRLTGCVPIQSLVDYSSEKYYGYIDSVQHEIINKKSYLHLTRADNPVSTLMLYHHHDQPLDELKAVCEAGLHGLQQLVYQPTVLAGGGCWQMGLANYLMVKVEAEMERLSEDLECPVSLIKETASLFTQALTTTALDGCHGYSISKLSGHVFKCEDDLGRIIDAPSHNSQSIHTCFCGIYTARDGEELVNLYDSQEFVFNNQVVSLRDIIDKQDAVLDSFSMCLNALQTAVLTASSILKIGQVLENL